MSHGFDLNSPLVCEGIIGDGCGGGRLFLVEDETLIAYDPETEEKIVLLEDIFEAKKVSKSGCIVEVECEKECIKFDLSALKKV
jgi:hypothetical protein